MSNNILQQPYQMRIWQKAQLIYKLAPGAYSVTDNILKYFE